MDFKDLELLLQRCMDNRELQVVDYTATKLLPAGENFGSIMVKIDAKIRKSRNAKEEMLHLVGKTPSWPADQPIIEWPLIFDKERFMYTELFPLYRQLEKEAGIDEEELIDVLPRFIGYRNSLNDSDNDVDQDSVLLMENLKIKGFYLANKRTGVDVGHARKALTSLARYHALGVVMKVKRASFASKAIDHAQVLGIDFASLDSVYEEACKILEESPRLRKHAAVIKATLETVKDGGTYKEQPIEPWATITHGDFWTNNMLFHKDDDGNVDDVKFVDFQTYLYASPLKDVCIFLGCSVDLETQSKHLRELLDLYYEAFVRALKRMGCDSSPFTRQSFDREVKKQAIFEFLHCTLAHKVFISEDIDQNRSNEENMNKVVNSKPSQAYIDRIVWLVEVYEKMQWL